MQGGRAAGGWELCMAQIPDAVKWVLTSCAAGGGPKPWVDRQRSQRSSEPSAAGGYAGGSGCGRPEAMCRTIPGFAEMGKYNLNT